MDSPTPAPAAAAEQTSRLLKAVAAEFDRAAAECLDGMSVPAWHVLAAVSGGVGRPMAALGAVTALPGPSLTRLIDGMVDENLVMRKPDESDRRRVFVYRTRRGTAVYDGIRARMDHSERLAALLATSGLLTGALEALLHQLRGGELSAAAAENHPA